MSDKLEKVKTPTRWPQSGAELARVTGQMIAETTLALNAAIDRVNELEGDIAELKGYQKGAGIVIKDRLDALEATFEGHTHKAILSHPLGPEGERYTYTQPPIAPKLPDNGKEEAK